MFTFILLLASAVYMAMCSTYETTTYHPTCGPYQIYDECGSACPITCPRYRQPQEDCPNECVKGCFCIPGYVWENEVGGRCISQSICHPMCRFNETPSDLYYNCQTCDGICTVNPNPGCFCKKRYLLSRITGLCVLPEDCPKQEHNGTDICPPNEVFTPCKNPCEATCETPKPPICNFLVCNKGCNCMWPLIRNTSTGECIEPRYCPVSCDDPNAEPSDCAPRCPVTCQNRSPQPCNKICEKGCICKQSYIKDEVSGKCIRKSECTQSLQ